MGVLYFMQKTSIILHFYIDGCFYFFYFVHVRKRGIAIILRMIYAKIQETNGEPLWFSIKFAFCFK